MIVFASNFMNHHQLPLCEELYDKTGGKFVFIATEPIPMERLKFGYEDLNDMGFVLKAYANRENAAEAEHLCRSADVLIIGSAPEHYISIRPKDKLVLRYSERPYKNYSKGKAFISEVIHHYRFITHKKIFILCASAYTAYDHAQFGMYRDKTFKWGYFPKVRIYNNIDRLIENKGKEHTQILWVGRLISWKHPETAIQTLSRLIREGIDATLKIIGDGDQLETLRAYVTENNLDSKVTFAGSMNPELVRDEMEKADIFLFTSDQNEGWGAVLNEAMNSACAVIANDEIGSVPFLINHEKNGLVYHAGNEDELYQCVFKTIKDKELRLKLQREAYATMVHEWSPQIAAKRLIELISCLQKGEKTKFQKGPCSRASVIREI